DRPRARTRARRRRRQYRQPQPRHHRGHAAHHRSHAAADRTVRRPLRSRPPAPIAAAMEAGVSAYVVKGLAQDRVRPVVDVAVAHFNRYHAMREELDRARLSLVERKTVDRAKGLLMEQKGLSEDAAYKLLRKLAMDQNKRIGEVAREMVTYARVLKS